MSLLGLPDPIVSRETIHTPHGRRSGRLYPLIPLLQGDPDTSIMSGLLTSVVSRETNLPLIAAAPAGSILYLTHKRPPIPQRSQTYRLPLFHVKQFPPFMVAATTGFIRWSLPYKELLILW